MKDTLLVNLSDPAIKRQMMIDIGRMTGLYEVYFKPRKRTRSLDQNAYYWAAIVTPFVEWLRENFGDSQIDKEQAHEMLKVKILGTKERVFDGESLYLVPHSKTLSVEEFEEYIEKCSAWLWDFCEILIVPCEEFYDHTVERPKKPASKEPEF